MKLTHLLPALTAALFLTGCGPSSSQAGTETDARAPRTAKATPAPVSDETTAVAAIASMLQLAEAGDWEAYIDTHYGEAHKFRGPEDRAALVGRFEQKWGTAVVEGLRRAAALAPVIEADGRATFAENGEPVMVLHKDATGRWTFHL